MSQPKADMQGHKNPAACEPVVEQAESTTIQSNPVELRILQDGRVYRSKAEMERLVALGHWHHRRQRRRKRHWL